MPFSPSRLKEHSDTTTLSIITLSSLSPPSLVANTNTQYPVIATLSHLPSDAISLTCAPQGMGGGGGVVVLTSNSVIYVEGNASRKAGCASNGWAERVSENKLTKREARDGKEAQTV